MSKSAYLSPAVASAMAHLEKVEHWATVEIKTANAEVASAKAALKKAQAEAASESPEDGE